MKIIITRVSSACVVSRARRTGEYNEIVQRPADNLLLSVQYFDNTFDLKNNVESKLS